VANSSPRTPVNRHEVRESGNARRGHTPQPKVWRRSCRRLGCHNRRLRCVRLRKFIQKRTVLDITNIKTGGQRQTASRKPGNIESTAAAVLHLPVLCFQRPRTTERTHCPSSRVGKKALSCNAFCQHGPWTRIVDTHYPLFLHCSGVSLLYY